MSVVQISSQDYQIYFLNNLIWILSLGLDFSNSIMTYFKIFLIPQE